MSSDPAFSKLLSSFGTGGGGGSGGHHHLWVLMLYGVHDQIKHPYKHKDATIAGRPWPEFFARCAALCDHSTPTTTTTSTTKQEGKESKSASASAVVGQLSEEQQQQVADLLWPSSLPDSAKTVWNARLFPVLSGPAADQGLVWAVRCGARNTYPSLLASLLVVSSCLAVCSGLDHVAAVLGNRSRRRRRGRCCFCFCCFFLRGGSFGAPPDAVATDAASLAGRRPGAGGRGRRVQLVSHSSSQLLSQTW